MRRRHSASVVRGHEGFEAGDLEKEKNSAVLVFVPLELRVRPKLTYRPLAGKVLFIQATDAWSIADSSSGWLEFEN